MTRRAVLLPAALLIACVGRKPHDITIQGDNNSAVPMIPAGDSVHVTATLWSNSNDITTRRRLPPGPEGFQWRLDTGEPGVASMTPNQVIHGLRPGAVRVYASTRGITGDFDFDVTWPLDSIELHFVTHTIRVGDTVELLHRVHLASGEIIPKGETFGIANGDGASPGWYHHSWNEGWGYRYDLNIRRFAGRMGLQDTLLLVGQRPGVARAGLVMLDRWMEDTIRVLPSDGSPARSYRRSAAERARPRESAFACFTFVLSNWTFGGGAWPDNWPPPAQYYGWAPGAIALDSTSIMPGEPDLGRRLDAARGEAMRGDRRWLRIAVDSVWLSMSTPHEYPYDSAMRSLEARFRVSPDRQRITGVAWDDDRRGRVSGRRISCRE